MDEVVEVELILVEPVPLNEEEVAVELKPDIGEVLANPPNTLTPPALLLLLPDPKGALIPALVDGLMLD